MPLIPKFSVKKAIHKPLDNFEQEKLRKVVEVLSYVGEDFTTNAKTRGSYTDQTRNLRGSIGYAVVHNGEV